MLTWVIVVLLNELAVGQKILILNVVNGQTPNVSQLYQATNTKNTAQESRDETTTAHERTDEQFLGRQEQGGLGRAVAIGKCPSSEHGLVKGTCEMNCNSETGECTEALTITSCNCTGGSRIETYRTNYQDGIETSAVGRRKRQVTPRNTCDGLTSRCAGCRKGGQGGTYSADSQSSRSCPFSAWPFV